MEIDELINVVPYEECWQQLFSEEQQHLQGTLGDTVVDIQHIGSTAVPGIEPIAVLETLGYEYLGEASVPGRLYLRKRYPHAFNLHLVQWGSKLWTNNLLLRDFLRTHPDESERYGQHKQELATSGIRTLLAYSEKKRALIAELLHRAQAWKA